MPWTVPPRKHKPAFWPLPMQTSTAQQAGRLGAWGHPLLHAYWAPSVVGRPPALLGGM